MNYLSYLSIHSFNIYIDLKNNVIYLFQFSSLPPNYDNVYLELSRRGARVLALGRKELGRLSHAEVNMLLLRKIELLWRVAGLSVR